MFGIDKRQLRIATFTDQGDRPVNEDALKTFESEQKKILVLCDGLGGHGMGDVASQLVVSQVIESLLDSQTEDLHKAISNSIEKAQEALRADQKKRHAQQKMKTTVAVAVVDQKKVSIAHIGDSRVYVFTKKKVLLQTRDHSVPQMLVDSKEIKLADIRFHPDRNILLKVMGIEWDKSPLEFEKDILIQKCEALLLCSDGFWELITEEEMIQTLNQTSSVQEWLEQMVKLVKIHGENVNMDNYSVIAARKE